MFAGFILPHSIVATQVDDHVRAAVTVGTGQRITAPGGVEHHEWASAWHETKAAFVPRGKIPHSAQKQR